MEILGMLVKTELSFSNSINKQRATHSRQTFRLIEFSNFGLEKALEFFRDEISDTERL
jgi:hypothetical protein